MSFEASFGWFNLREREVKFDDIINSARRPIIENGIDGLDHRSK